MVWAIADPALAARFWVTHIHRGRLSCPDEVQWDVPQWVMQWLDGRPNCRGQYAAVMGPEPDDYNSMAYQSPRYLGTVKASLRFARPLPTMNTLIAYVQYGNI